MKKRSKSLLLFVLTCLALCLLVACGQASSTEEEATPAAEEQQEAAATEETTETEEAAAGDELAGTEIPTLGFTPGHGLGGLVLPQAVEEPEELSDSEAAEADRAIRAYTPPEQDSLLINEAKHFYYYEQLKGDQKAFYEVIDSLLQDPTSDDRVVALSLKSDADMEQVALDFFVARYAVQYDHPEYFWFYDDIETSINPRVNNGKLYVFLENTYDNYEEEMTAFNDAAAAILNDVDLTASDVDIALEIHDKLMDLAAYDYPVLEKSDSDFAHTAYGILVENSSGDDNMAVCDGYAQAYEYLLQQAGIECTVILGEAGDDTSSMGGHAWNAVKLDGDWYEIDCTWDDNMTEIRDAVDQEKQTNPDNAVIPYFEEALNNESYYRSITHYLFGLTTKQITDYTPSEDYVYSFSDGAQLNLVTPSVHVRCSKLEREKYGACVDLMKFAPRCKGKKYAGYANK